MAAGKSSDALALALSRTYLSLELLKGGLDVTAARCGADRLVREFSMAELNDPTVDQRRVLRSDRAVPAARAERDPRATKLDVICWCTAVPCVTMAAQLHHCRSYGSPNVPLSSPLGKA